MVSQINKRIEKGSAHIGLNQRACRPGRHAFDVVRHKCLLCNAMLPPGQYTIIMLDAKHFMLADATREVRDYQGGYDFFYEQPVEDRAPQPDATDHTGQRRCAFCRQVPGSPMLTPGGHTACLACAHKLVDWIITRAEKSDPEALQFKAIRSLIGVLPVDHA